MVLNIFEKRIKAWEEQYGSLSPEIQRKIDKLVENYDRTQNVEKDYKEIVPFVLTAFHANIDCCNCRAIFKIFNIFV